MTILSSNPSSKSVYSAERNANAADEDSIQAHMRGIASDAGHVVRDFLHRQTDNAAELRHRAEDQISEHPLRSVALAALSGFVIGALLRR